MRALASRLTSPAPCDLRRALERLDGLPLRPTSAHLVLDALPEEDADGHVADAGSGVPALHAVAEVDPGWALALSRPGGPTDPLGWVASRPWWTSASAEVAEAIARIWRHSVAVGLAARRLARDAGEPDPDGVGRAGLLHGLGRWAVAALAPEFLASWLAEDDPRRRRELERRRLGTEMTALGRTLAERWGCDPLVVDASWLHADGEAGLGGCASEPSRLALVQEAYAWAERTPWSLGRAEPREPVAGDPRLRVLIAEVQVRCVPAFVEPDATPREEHLARSNARLRRQMADLRAGQAARDRFLDAFAHSDPSERPEAWADRAGLSWCGEPGVATARVVWTGPGASSPPVASTADGRPATRVLSLADRGRPAPRSTCGPSPGPTSFPTRRTRRWGPGGRGRPGSPRGCCWRDGSRRPSRRCATGSSARSRGSARRSWPPWPSSPRAPGTS